MDIETVKKNRAALVAALRSGEYKQVRGTISLDDGFCCLGVAACILAGSRKRDDIAKFVDRGTYGDLWGVLNKTGAEAFGLRADCVGANEEPEEFSRSQRCLSERNDNGCNFEEIANYIEKMPLPLPEHLAV
jgi:hypothetical protein